MKLKGIITNIESRKKVNEEEEFYPKEVNFEYRLSVFSLV